MSINLLEPFLEFKEFRNIDRVTMMSILEDTFRSTLVKQYGTDENIDVIINVEKGDLEIWRNRMIVEDDQISDKSLEIALSEALKIEPDFEVGEEVSEPVKLSDFGRRSILTIKQTLASRILDLSKDNIFRNYKDREGDIIVTEVYQIWKNEILLLDDEGNEIRLPKTEQIPGDYFKKGDSVKAIIKKVDIVNNNPIIIVSRVDNRFLERLLENEVPGVFDGLITIKNIARFPGERSKIAVESYDDRVDPVGACVGLKGSRIHGIVRELRNENIDIINFSNNKQLFIQRSLSPAKVSRVEIDGKKANVFLKPDQLALAIGKGGFNIRLAGQLTGYDISVYSDIVDDEDVNLEEFMDEIEQFIIDELKLIGCDTAKSVLSLSREDLIKRTDLEEETIDEVLSILRKEFA